MQPETTRSPWIDELGLGLEVTALAAFAFSRPVLDSFGRSPETFIARRATTADIILFGVVVAFAPALVAVAVGAVSRFIGPAARLRVHLGLIVVIAGTGAWRMGRDITGWPNDATKLLLAGIVIGPLVGLLRWRVPTSATFLRYAGAASVIFLLQFLVMSPTSDLAFGTPAGVDPAVHRQVAADLGDDPPSVVVLVLDELPTAALLDGTGQVDAELFPNIGAFAATSTWYRNHTTVATFTTKAVPSLLSGRLPRATAPPPRAGSENLFTLLGGNYALHVREEVTRVCPADLCPREASEGVGPLLDEAVTWWQGQDGEKAPVVFDLEAALHDGPGDNRYTAAEEMFEDLDVKAGGKPDLTFFHVLLPHSPYRFTEDGTLYDGDLPSVGEVTFGWSAAGAEIGRQRHILQAQAADRLVGQLMGRLRDAGVFDDSLVVLTADHGQAFLPDIANRVLDGRNFPEVLWSPLFIKVPGQTGAEIDDGNVMSIDVFPTIADELGVDIPWEVDGIPVADVVAKRDPHQKFVVDNEMHFIHPEDGELIEVDARDHFDEVLVSDPVAATGEDAVWRRTEHGDLFRQKVDDLRVGEPADAELRLDEPDLDDVDLDEPLPLEMVGFADLELGAPVAFALNGTIGAVTTVEDMPGDGGLLVHGIVHPDLFEDGANELTAYLVDGPPGDETLRPLAVVT